MSLLRHNCANPQRFIVTLAVPLHGLINTISNSNTSLLTNRFKLIASVRLYISKTDFSCQVLFI